MIELTDQLKRKIVLPSVPKKIISLVPSQTELLFELGLNEQVIGITKFCIHPDSWFRNKTRVGGTKKIDLGKVMQLNPDMIICNKEENDMIQVKELMKHFAVWVSDISTLADALEMIHSIGKLVGKEECSLVLQNNIRKLCHAFKTETLLAKFKPLTTAYVIWKDPLMVAGGGTFIHDMLLMCGLKNTFGKKTRYPEIAMEELATASPDLILLSSEPFPFKEKHINELKAFCPASKIILVDGEYFSWYGSRILKAPDYFRSLVKLIHSVN